MEQYNKLHTEEHEKELGFLAQVNHYYNELILSPLVLLFAIHIVLNATILYSLGRLKYFFLNFVVSFVGFLIAMYVIIFIVTMIVKLYKRWKDGSRER